MCSPPLSATSKDNNLLRFPEDRILREQVAYIRKTDPISLYGIVVASAIASYVVYDEIASTSIFYWMAGITVLTVFWGIAQSKFPALAESSPRTEARVRVTMAVIYSFVWGSMVVNYLPGATPLMMVTLTMITGAIVAGSVATQSPCLPLCAGFITPNMALIIFALFTRGEAIDIILSIGATLYFMALVLCMITIENTVRNSIILHFEKEELIEQLQTSMSETLEATNTKSRFLASASHDLRQPIQAMSLVSEALQPTELTEYQRNLFGHLRSAIDSTRGLVDSLLDFSKVDAGAILPVLAPFSVEALFSRLESELTPLAQDKDLLYRHRSTSAVAESDIQIIEMILRNLVGNAIRYTDKGGVLLACRHRKQEGLIFEVWDTGVGLTEENKKEIFKEFRQVGEQNENQKQGFGLGLAISQGLAKTIGSEISVYSKPGRGSVFRFHVPKSDASIIYDKSKDNKNESQDFSGMSILVIDDSERIRVSMLALLESWGCRCIATETIAEALPNIAYFQPDLLLVDYRLQNGITGTHAINNIRTFMGKDLPAVIITGDSASERFNEIEGTQPAMMRKPVSAVELKMMISSILLADEDTNRINH